MCNSSVADRGMSRRKVCVCGGGEVSNQAQKTTMSKRIKLNIK